MQLCRALFIKTSLIARMLKKSTQLWVLKDTLGHLLSISSTLSEQILCTKVLFGSFFYLHVTAKKRRLNKKCTRKTLMKLTPDVLKSLLTHFRFYRHLLQIEIITQALTELV